MNTVPSLRSSRSQRREGSEGGDAGDVEVLAAPVGDESAHGDGVARRVPAERLTRRGADGPRDRVGRPAEAERVPVVEPSRRSRYASVCSPAHMDQELPVK